MCLKKVCIISEVLVDFKIYEEVGNFMNLVISGRFLIWNNVSYLKFIEIRDLLDEKKNVRVVRSLECLY